MYVQNLAHAIASLPQEEREQVRLSVYVPSSQGTIAGSMPPLAHHLISAFSILRAPVYVHRNRLYKVYYYELCNLLARKVSFIPRKWLNPQKFDFVYPELGDERTPYRWGGWIPDFQYRYMAHFFSKKEIATFDSVYQKLADLAPVIVLSSRMTHADFNRFYPQAASRSTVMNFVSYIQPEWFQIDPKEIQTQYELPDGFFLMSSQFWRHKGHETVIEALGIMKERNLKPVVALTGSLPNPNHSQHPYYREVVERVQEMGLGQQVRILGLIPRMHQIQLMRRSLAVVQPSLFEGWSTVVEDVRALGKPIFLSDFPVHLEQDPPHAHFFERSNAEQLARLIETTLPDLKPGPDPNWEAEAKRDNAERMVAFGRRFLEIARSVL